MTRVPSSLRYLLPVVASGVVSFALCAAMAVFLFREQATSAEDLRENITSHRAAADLEESLTALIALLRDRVEGVAALNDRIARHIDGARSLANTEVEQDLVNRIEAGFQRYLAMWQALPNPPAPERDRLVLDAIFVLEAQSLKRSQELREYNAHRIDEAERSHRATLRGLAWGLAGISGSAAVAGLFLGYGVARGLARSIQRLQIRVQDAAGKLGRDLPPVELAGGRLDQLDRQVQALVQRIEGVVERLHEREREVLRAEQLAAVGQLAAGMAHELRNPMTSIQMLVQAAREGGPNGGLAADDLAVIEREVRRVERSLQTFLDFARPPRPAKSPTDLARVVTGTLDLTRGRADRQRVAVRFDPPADPVTVDGDPDQLRQVLVNLVLNALDAMPAGGRLDLDLRPEGTDAEVRVRDTGPGVAAEVRDKLFRPFVSTKETGLGLGLVISQRIVEDHGGTIRAGDAAGGGAVFTVRLPIRNGTT
jgi:two-component system, NtrC family, sensor histidine kinase HydH